MAAPAPAFVGIHNLRDYGGYAVAGGGRVRSGRLYRSAQHRDATAADLEAIAALDLRLVIDLRGANEGAAAPCPRPPGFAARVVRASGATSGLAPHLAAAAGTPGPDEARTALLHGYAGMPFRPGLVPLLAEMFAALAETDGASLVHCMAGKDRTGLACALVHAALGVHRDDIMADYIATNTAGDPEARIAAAAATVRARYGALDDETLRVVMSVEPAYLDAAFAAIEAAHGSVEAYLRDRLGVDAARRAALAARLVA